jgi:hypothetical protein
VVTGLFLAITLNISAAELVDRVEEGLVLDVRSPDGAVRTRYRGRLLDDAEGDELVPLVAGEAQRDLGTAAAARRASRVSFFVTQGLGLAVVAVGGILLGVSTNLLVAQMVAVLGVLVMALGPTVASISVNAADRHLATGIARLTDSHFNALTQAHPEHEAFLRSIYDALVMPTPGPESVTWRQGSRALSATELRQVLGKSEVAEEYLLDIQGLSVVSLLSPLVPSSLLVLSTLGLLLAWSPVAVVSLMLGAAATTFASQLVNRWVGQRISEKFALAISAYNQQMLAEARDRARTLEAPTPPPMPQVQLFEF